MSFDSRKPIKLTVEVLADPQTVLAGLDIWLNLNLIANLELQLPVLPASASRMTIVINAAAVEAHLLSGLAAWLDMELISTLEVNRLGRQSLSCAIPDIEVALPLVNSPAADVWEPTPVPEFSLPQRPPSRFAQMVRSLFAEFSLIWLLFLGVFLVVVSSGVLAASQWSQFPPLGQYGILLTYTLAFWAVSIWTGRQSNLHLTTRTLQIVTLAIVPVNFWAIDQFGLLNSFPGLISSAIAATLLISLMRIGLRQYRATQLVIYNCIALSLLHLGWSIPGYALVAVYIGIVGTAIATFGSRLELQPSPDHQSPSGAFSIPQLAIAYATLLLLARAVLVTGIPVSQIGLAIGLCGWMAGRINLQSQGSQSTLKPALKSTTPRLPLAEILLLLGWITTVGVEFPWQALAVSGLAVWLLAERLLRFWQLRDLTAMFGIGLQSLWLVSQLVPIAIRTDLLAWSSRLIGSDTALPLVSLGLFPYVALMLGLSDWLYRRGHIALAQRGEILAAGLGIVLACLSFLNPITRSLNLSLSAIALFGVSQRRLHPDPKPIYLTHLMGWAAIASTIDLVWPGLPPSVWGNLVLAATAIEWWSCDWRSPISTTEPVHQIWHESAWYTGITLASLSFCLLLFANNFVNSLVTLNAGSIIWLSVPAGLTLLSRRPAFRYAGQAIGLSTVALLAAQLLTFSQDVTRPIGLGIAALIMLVNSLNASNTLNTLNASNILKVSRPVAALLTVGLGLASYLAVLWQVSASYDFWQRFDLLVNGSSIAVIGLLAIRYAIRRGSNNSNLFTGLLNTYAQSLDKWAIAIATLSYTVLTLVAAANYADDTFNYDFDYGFDYGFTGFLTSTALITIAIAYRSTETNRSNSNREAYLVGWGLELLAAGVISLNGGSLTSLAIANLGLGLLAQIVGDLWLMRTGLESFPLAWHVLPVIYGLAATCLRWGTFADWTGLISLTSALIGIGIGRRRPQWQWLTYVSMVGVTVSVYELLGYQLLARSPGGSIGDGLVAMAGLGTLMALTYRLLAHLWMPYLRLAIAEIEITAHLHWAIANGLIILAASTLPSQSGGQWGSAIALLLAIYAIWHGRARWSQSRSLEYPGRESWVYAGITTLLISGAYLVYLAFPNPEFIDNIWHPYGGAIACLFAFGLYHLPWVIWGWSDVAWRRSAFSLPAAIVLLTATVISSSALLVVAAFYLWLARIAHAIRLSYVSLVLVNWALLRYYQTQNSTNPLWYVLPLGLSLLYAVHVDPAFRTVEARGQRHLFRLFGVGAVCLTAAMQSLDNTAMAIAAIAIALGFILAGLSLRIRAYLYGGTLTFTGVVLGQVALFAIRYSLLIWGLGILAGVAFIWIAANFESRRDRILALFQGLIVELEAWD